MFKKSRLTPFLKLLFITLTLWGCKTTQSLKNDSLRIKFLDEFILSSDFQVNDEVYGGISGIDYKNGQLIMVNDSPSNPLLFSAELDSGMVKLANIKFTSVISLDNDTFFENNALDMESIRFDGKDYLISTEGSINKGLPPKIFKVSTKGRFIKDYPLPDYFLPNGNNSPRHNGVFEGLSKSLTTNGFWFANELPLENDGPEPKLYATKSPIRLSYFDRTKHKVTRQYAMDLDRLTKLPLLPFGINGLTEILQLQKDKFLVLERSYSAGHKSRGNKAKLYLVDISKASNIKDIEQLKSASDDIIYAQKHLVFDFNSVKRKLTNRIIDNLEGLCFGPTLPNGNRTLLLVSDNNFNNFGTQLNQLILLEMKSKL